MFRTCCISSDKGEIYLSFRCSRKLYLCPFCGFFKPLKSHLIVFEINTLFFSVFVNYPVNYLEIKIIAAKISVTICWFNLYNAFANFEYRNVKGSATQVVDGNLFLFLLVHAVGKCGSSWLIYYPEDIQTRNSAGIFSSLSLAVIKICGNGDDRIRDLFPQVVLSCLFQFL